MNPADLLNPGVDQLAQTVRHSVAKLISNKQNEVNPGPSAAAFLLDAAQRTPGYTPPALPSTQTLVNTNQSVPAYSPQGTSLGFSGTLTVWNNQLTRFTPPATHAFVTSGTRVINGKTVTLTVANGTVTDVVIA